MWVEPLVHARVLLSPPEAKLLASMLNNEVRRYEQRFGRLPSVNSPAPAESAESAEPAAAAAIGEVIQ